MLQLNCSKDSLARFLVIRFFADIPHAWCSRYKLVTDIDKIRAEGSKIKYTENAMYALRWCFRMPTVNGNLRQLRVWDAVAVVQTSCQIKLQTLIKKKAYYYVKLTDYWLDCHCIQKSSQEKCNFMFQLLLSNLWLDRGSSSCVIQTLLQNVAGTIRSAGPCVACDALFAESSSKG